MAVVTNSRSILVAVSVDIAERSRASIVVFAWGLSHRPTTIRAIITPQRSGLAATTSARISLGTAGKGMTATKSLSLVAK